MLNDADSGVVSYMPTTHHTICTKHIQIHSTTSSNKLAVSSVNTVVSKRHNVSTTHKNNNQLFQYCNDKHTHSRRPSNNCRLFQYCNIKHCAQVHSATLLSAPLILQNQTLTNTQQTFVVLILQHISNIQITAVSSVDK